MKRLIVCCDGTFEDADTAQDPDMYTNVARFARALLPEDNRS